jgi:hypothetical protein
MCKRCDKEVKTWRGKQHNCPGSGNPCWRCGAVHSGASPYCFIQPLDDAVNQSDDDGDESQPPTRSTKKPVRYVIFDCESTQEKVWRRGLRVRRHHVNLIVAEVICENCLRDGYTMADSTSYAPDCVCDLPYVRAQHRRQLLFDNFNDVQVSVVEEFLEWLLHTGPKDCLTIVLSHNGGRYDIHLCLHEMYRLNYPVKMTAQVRHSTSIY